MQSTLKEPASVSKRNIPSVTDKKEDQTGTNGITLVGLVAERLRDFYLMASILCEA